MSGIGANLATSAGEAASTIGLYSLILFIFAAIIGVIAFLIYKKSFNVDIMIIRNANGTDVHVGLKGKFYLKGKNNEYRFKIWGAKRHKLLYNEEGIKREDVYIVMDTKTKKNRDMVILSPNTEGFLVPLKVQPRIYEELYDVLQPDGSNIKEVKRSAVLKSEYGSVDVSWLQSEAAKFKDLFDDRAFLDKWGTLLILIGMILVTGGLIYVAYQFGKSAENMAFVLDSQSQLISAILNSNSTSIQLTQPINTIIAG